MLTDYPKLHCPFIRKEFDVNKHHWQELGNKYGLRKPIAYLVIDQINPGFEWVFDDPDTFAVEKLDGTNVKILTKNGRLLHIQNRKNVIDPLEIIKGKTFIIEGIFRAIQKGYVLSDGEQVGEIIGPKLQNNPYFLDNHIWYPFDKAIGHLRYKSFEEHDRTFDNWSSWFRNFLKSRFCIKTHKCTFEEAEFAEGIIFYNLKRKAEKKCWRAKLRRNMFVWYYEDKGIIIKNYPQ